MKPSPPNPSESVAQGYIGEYMAAFERAKSFGLKTPPRVLLAKDCVDPDRTLAVLLEYFERHVPHELVGQTAAINMALIALLIEATGVPFQLTIGWIELDGKPKFQHGEDTIRRFMAEKSMAWEREGLPFHLWLTSPACEIVDVTFAMNLGWAKSREECARLVIYKSAHSSQGDPVYHPTLVGEDFLQQSGLFLKFSAGA
jgi:hypothetical protein